MRTNTRIPCVIPMEDSKPLRVLCIEDDPDDLVLVRLAARRFAKPLQWQCTDNALGVTTALAQGVDIVLSDYHLGGYSPLRAIAEITARGLDIPLIVVSNAVGEGAAVEVLRAGAADYVSKDRLATLPMVITRVLEARDQRERQRRLLADNRAVAQRLKSLAAELVQAQENERRHLADSLHDSLGQTLTALQLHMQAADAADSTDEARSLREKSFGILRDAISQMRTLSFAVRPAQLDDQGLVVTVQSLAEVMLAPAGVDFELQTHGVERKRGGVQSALGFRVVQEAVTNAMRHARPQRMVVRLRFRDPGSLEVMVADDGVGFDTRRPHERTAIGRGLSTMGERCELTGGSLRVRSQPGRGTVLRACLGEIR